METLIKDLRSALPRATSTPDLAEMDRFASKVRTRRSAEVEEIFDMGSPRSSSDSSDENVSRFSASKRPSLLFHSPRGVRSRSSSPGIDRKRASLTMKQRSDGSRVVGSVLNREREARRHRKYAVDTKHLDSPAIYVEGEMVLSEGPLPAFVPPRTLEEVLQELPTGAHRCIITCIGAWRMGHLDTRSLVGVLSSFRASGGAALRSLLALSCTPAPSASSSNSSSPPAEMEFELLSEADMAALRAL